MRKVTPKVLLIAGVLMACSSLVHAAGFNIYEAGVRATALGGAFTATADDGSALFYNASGMSFMDRSSVSLNIMPIQPRMKFAEANSDVTEEVAHNTFLVPGAYYTNSNNEKVAFGVGVYAPFGLGVEWMNPTEFVGRQVSYDVEIQTVYVTPAVSFRVADAWAVSIGLDVAHQALDLKKMTLQPTSGANAIDTHIEGSSSINITPSFGLMFRPNEKISAGLMYHHEKTMKYEDQDVTMTNVMDPNHPNYVWAATLLAGLNGGVPTSTLTPTISSELNLPSILSIGLAYKFTPRLALEGNYVRFGWGTFQSLPMDFSVDALDQEIHFNYKDTWQVRFGLDYVAIPEKLNIMVGYVHDKSPQPAASVSPILPDADRNDYSFGLQYKHKSWDFTGCYMAVIADKRQNIENDRPANPDPAYPVGEYSNVANIFGLSVGYHF